MSDFLNSFIKAFIQFFVLGVKTGLYYKILLERHKLIFFSECTFKVLDYFSTS